MTSRDIHVYPLKDLWGHVLSGTDCPCEPRVELEGENLIVVHNSFDHREIIEEAIRVLNSEEE